MEDSQNEKAELTPEEKLQNANSKAEALIQEFESKKSQYDTILKEINAKKDDIDTTLSEINASKQAFINDTIGKSEEYRNDFESLKSNIATLKESSTNTFKTLDTQYNELIEKYKTDANIKINEIDQKVIETTELLKNQKETFDKFINENKTTYDKNYENINTLISQYKASTTESLTSIKARLDEATENASKIKQTDADMKAYKSNVNEYISNMTTKTEEINEKTKKYNEDTQAIINANKEQTIEIDKLLRLATGRSLFYSFHKRKKDLENAQLGWLIALGCSIGLLILFSMWLVLQFSQIDWQHVDWFVDIILKISASTPILYLVAFVTDRYTKERRLVEEYAFKSTISLALKPYFDLVSDKNLSDDERNFLIKSIENIFTTPTDKVYRTKECQNKIDIAHISELQNAVKNIDSKIKEGKE